MPKKPKTLALVPASARMPSPKSVHSALDVPQSIRDAIRSFEIQIGGRQALLEALSTADSSEDVKVVLEAIADPKHDQESLAKLCAQAGVSPGQLFGAFRTAATVRGQILGSLKAAELVPAVVEEIGKSAFPYETVCAICNGVGSFEEEKKDTLVTRTCSACNGVGSIRKDANPDQQRTILELTGLVKSGGAQQVNVQANIQAAPSSAGGSLEQLQQAVSELIYSRPAVSDGVVLESPPKE